MSLSYLLSKCIISSFSYFSFCDGYPYACHRGIHRGDKNMNYLMLLNRRTVISLIFKPV